MKIIAIDPGSMEAAIVALTVKSMTVPPTIDEVGKIDAEALSHRLSKSRYDLILCERIANGGMADKHTLETAEWVGDYRAVARVNGRKFKLCNRSEVKKIVTGASRGRGDPEVTAAICARYVPGQKNKGKGTVKQPGYFHGFDSHNYQAFALFVYWLTTEGFAVLRKAA